MNTYHNPNKLEVLMQEASSHTQLEFLNQQKQKRLRGAFKAAKYALATFISALLLEPILRTADGN